MNQLPDRCLACASSPAEASAGCKDCEWIQRATRPVDIRLVDLDPGGVRRKSEERARRALAGWERLPTTRRNFSALLKDTECWSCGSPESLQIDHWDNDRSNNSDTNARTLCLPCHKKKTDLALTDRDPFNERFIHWVHEQCSNGGKPAFRRRQEESKRHHVYQTVCSKRRYPHSHEYCREEIDMYKGYCPFCPIFSSKLKLLSERIEIAACKGMYAPAW